MNLSRGSLSCHTTHDATCEMKRGAAGHLRLGSASRCAPLSLERSSAISRYPFLSQRAVDTWRHQTTPSTDTTAAPSQIPYTVRQNTAPERRSCNRVVVNERSRPHLNAQALGLNCGNCSLDLPQVLLCEVVDVGVFPALEVLCQPCRRVVHDGEGLDAALGSRVPACTHQVLSP